MPKIEKRLVEFLSRHILVIGFAAMLAASVIVRLRLLPFYTNDMNVFLLPWVQTFREKGIAVLGEGVGNYNIIYLVILYFISQLTATQDATMHAIKLVSIVFDYAMAAGVGLLVYRASVGRRVAVRRRWAWFAFALTTLLPMVLLNSGLWGQCDSVYACFCIWAVYFLVREKYPMAMLMLGLGFCFKLQAVFIFPLFVLLYAVKKQFSVLLFAILPLLLFLSSLPAIVFGADKTVGFDIYFKGQLAEYEDIFINYPNLAALIQDGRYDYFSTGLVLLALLVCLGMLALLLRRGAHIDGYGTLLLAVWSVYACVLFLPSMHERYAYAGEVLVWAAVLARPSRKTIVPALVFTFAGYNMYCAFLFHFMPVPVQYVAMASLVAFGYWSWMTVKALTAPLPDKNEKGSHHAFVGK